MSLKASEISVAYIDRNKDDNGVSEKLKEIMLNSLELATFISRDEKFQFPIEVLKNQFEPSSQEYKDLEELEDELYEVIQY